MTKIVVALTLITLVLSSMLGCGTKAPEARFTGTPTTGQVPVRVQFTDLSRGNVSTWAWDFDNDGVVDSSLQNPQHIYNQPGNYTVTLTVCGRDGNDTEVKVDYLKFTHASCQPDFVAESTAISGVRPVQFTDQSTGDIIGWEWDFGDGGSSTEQNPTHTYERNGSYSVTLTIFTPDCKHTLTKYDYIRVTGCHT